MEFGKICRNIVVLVCTWVLSVEISAAQLPVCGPGATRYVYTDSAGDNNTIYNWNPFLPLSATNPSPNTISLPTGSMGLAIGANINDPLAPSPTFYTSVGGTYYYYDGVSWINTGHGIGAPVSPNFGAGGGYIYNLDANTGAVYRYDGTGNSVLVATVTDFPILGLGGGPYDVVVDCAGNFYLMRCYTPAWLRKYSPSGILLEQWELRGAPVITSGAGFAITDNLLTFQNLRGLFQGTIHAGSAYIDVTVVPNASFFPQMPGDFANCAISDMRISVVDTLYACDTGGVSYMMSGTAPFAYQVLRGAATVTHNGADFQIRPTTAAQLVITARSASGCPDDITLRDTLWVIPPPQIDAGTDRTIHGCGGAYEDTLRGVISGGQPWIDYAIAWQSPATIVHGNNTLSPVIRPVADTRYVLTVTTAAERGGCSFSDTIFVTVQDETVTAGFDATISMGCAGDTVRVTNLSAGAVSYAWDFGDHSPVSDESSPVHVYQTQGVYTVRLIAANSYCSDTVMQTVSTMHTLRASFTPDDDTVCMHETVAFTNTTESMLPLREIAWSVQGTPFPGLTPEYTFHDPGLYEVQLVAIDSLGCRDTARHLIQVDSLPELQILIDDTAVCAGVPLQFSAVYTLQGFQELSWDPGDGTTGYNAPTFEHAYTDSGTYPVVLTALYRACGAVSVADTVTVFPVPSVDLGPDTTVCAAERPLILSNRQAAHAGDQYFWNTGDRTRQLTVREAGEYSLQVVSARGCTASGKVRVDKACELDIPNAFTPDGDGINDYFLPKPFLPQTVNRMHVQVFNRWGQLVYEAKQPQSTGWDGTLNGVAQPSGVYVYRIEVSFLNSVVKRYEGNVTLLR